MAKPRVFISSTFYDLRTIRADLERFIKEIGYEPVLFERGHIAYGKDDPLESYCYREITICDIVVVVIGGKYGSLSTDAKNSITQKELSTAINGGKQLYIFIEKSVLNEYKTYFANKNVPGFIPVSVSDTKVFSFIEEILALPSGNPVEGFEISEDITKFLKEQFAGLFQRLLQESTRKQEIDIIENLKSTAKTLNNLVSFLTDERKNGDQAIKDILLATHPAFEAVKNVIKSPYRIVFYNISEMEQFLAVRYFKKDEFNENNDSIEYDNDKMKKGIRISKSIFDADGNLKVFKPNEWQDSWICEYPIHQNLSDDDLPF